MVWSLAETFCNVKLRNAIRSLIQLTSLVFCVHEELLGFEDGAC